MNSRVCRAIVGLIASSAALLAAPTTLSRAGTKAPLPVTTPIVAPNAGRHALDAAAREPATDVRIAPSPSGRLGAWLLLGPYRSPTATTRTRTGADPLPQEADEAKLSPKLGSLEYFGTAAPAPPPKKPPPAWLLASSGEGPIDVKGALHATDIDIVAYAAGTLHVESPGRFYLLLGVDDGVRVSVDGRSVFTRDESRPERDDDDLIPLDLAAGDHPVVLRLHQRDGAWSFHTRLVDSDLSPPVGSYLALPGTSANDARDLAAKMSWISVDRGDGASPGGYEPKLTVKFLEGAPRGVPLRVQAKLARPKSTLFQVDAGEAPIDAAGVGELVVALPSVAGADLASAQDAEWSYEITVAGRTVRPGFFPRRATREALAHADRATASLSAQAPSWLAPGALESVMHLRARLGSLVSRGDTDTEAQIAEARELEAASQAIDEKRDPYASRTGAMRRAYLSPADGELAEFGLYVPASYRPGTKRTYPLIVALHGLNGKPMAMMRWFFGGDEVGKDQDWEDRHTGPLAPLDAFVVTPGGHGNTMYRDLGEDDVLRVIDWASSTYPVDANRVTITGPSMGGIGSAAIAFRKPDRFAAAAPLCGYHSLLIRRDIAGRPTRPWERLLAEERSNVYWALNGEHIPLWIVHGTQDQPEANSGVLIEKYEKLKYSIVHDHPELGHNVWQTTYEGLKGAKWLMQYRRNPHPPSIHFRTMRLRNADDAWVHIDELAQPDAWGEVSARVRSKTAIEVTATHVGALRFDRDPLLVDAGAMTVTLNGTPIAVDAGEPLLFHAEGSVWKKGPATHDGPWKRGELTGPIRDAFHAPLLFVYGAGDPTQARANEEVARAWAQIRYGVTVRYPLMSDTDFFARGESLANDRALFLVGNAKSNRVVRALEEGSPGAFPITIQGDAMVVGNERFTGKQLGAMFIRPNPKKVDRYVVVVEGIDALGTWRSLSLPDLLPDFVVYDEAVGPARGQMLLNAGMVRAAGFFRNDWSLPATIADPLATVERAGAKSESDATPYLP